MYWDNNLQVFFNLLKAGLWEQEARLLPLGEIDYESVFQLAHEQSVQGLVLQGIEELKAKGIELSVPKVLLLQLIGEVQVIEQRNKEMNVFVAELIEKLSNADIYALLVKGQGIAQCYARPLWRTCGDVDLFLDEENYQKAKMVLAQLADSEEPEVLYRMHKAYSIKGWEVELHGNMRGRFLKRVDRVADEVQKVVFEGNKYRFWNCSNTKVRLPNIDEDIIFVFAHILQHFFIEGIGLRQICDWCRLLWTYKTEIDIELLENRLRKMGMMTEWKTFGSLAVDSLGMPEEAMPFYDSRYKKKGARALDFVMETGNFGFNRHVNETFKYPVIIRKVISFLRHTRDSIKYFRMFPLDALKIWFEMVGWGIKGCQGTGQ